jgi:hypothetical protein
MIGAVRFGYGPRVVVSAAAACAVLVSGAANASATAAKPQSLSSRESAAAAASGGWGAGVEAAVPANAVGTSVVINSVSCPSAGNCSAVGDYYASTDFDGSEGLLLTETAGRWAPGVEAALPANADPSPSVGLSSISCASAGNCTAVGTYQTNSSSLPGLGSTQGLLLTEVAGTWSTGVEAPLPANAASDPYVQWGDVDAAGSVSCASAGNCAAAGLYSAAGGGFEGLLLTQTDASWSAPVPTASGWLNSVSCPSAGNCTAVGNGQAWTETAESWAQVALPANSTDDELTSVSCVSVGNCTAVGLSDTSFPTYPESGPGHGKGQLLTETAGSWAPGVEAALPANAEGAGAVDQETSFSVSCASAGNCTAGGTYLDSSGDNHGLLLTQTGDNWTPGVEAALPADAATSSPDSAVDSVSCALAGSCAAVGSYQDGLGHSEGLLLTETAGSWATGVEAALPANAGTPDSSAGLDSVSCPPSGSCTAVGTYRDNLSNERGLLIGGSPAMVKLDVSTRSGTGAGTVSSTPAGIACGSTCSASFPAGTSLTLTATPSPGSTFTGWSGGGCSGTGSCQVDTAIAEQPIEASFSLPFEVDVSRRGTGSGTVASLPAGIACGPTCSASFVGGTTVTLTATPARGSRFSGWSEACSGTGSCQLSNLGTGGFGVGATFDLLPCVVPKLDGNTLKAAEHAIRAHNCALGKIKHVASRTIKKDHVISQKPRAGTRLKHGAKVNLVVSRGRR